MIGSNCLEGYSGVVFIFWKANVWEVVFLGTIS